MLSDFYLVQHVNEPSRETSTVCSVSLIDHVVRHTFIEINILLQTCGLSDHRGQIATLGCYPSQAPSRSYQIHSFWRCNWEELREALHSAPWYIMSVYDDIDDEWDYFYALLQECLNKFLPLNAKRSPSRRS